MSRVALVLALILAIALEVVANTICFLAFVLMPFVLASCPRPISVPPAPACAPGASQCMGDGEHVELCDEHGRWVRTQTCAPVDGVRTYCVQTDNNAATCMPSEAP